MTKVVVQSGESFESMLKRFNKKVHSDRVLWETRRRRFFEKPSVIRKRKKAAKLRKSRQQTFKDQPPEQQKAQLLDWSKENVIEMVLIRQEAKKHGDPIPEAELKSVLAKIKEQYDDLEQYYKDFFHEISLSFIKYIV